MTTEVWFRRADKYPDVCIDLMLARLSFRAENVTYRAADMSRWLIKAMPPQVDYRCLIVGDIETLELRRDHPAKRPYAVYPSWNYQGDKLALLEELCDESLDAPEHRISIVNPPKATTGLGRAFYRTLAEIQTDYPEAILHISEVHSFRHAFGFGFASVDIDPSREAYRSTVILPNGRCVKVSKLMPFQQWVSVLGFSLPSLRDEETRVRYNIRSAEWAAQYWGTNLAFKSRGTGSDPDAIDPPAPTTIDIASASGPPMVGDKVLCDQCSLAPHCKFFRTGEVCSLPGSEAAQLATTFQTRDPDTIMDGLSKLMTINARRLEDGLEREESYGGSDNGAVDPTITSLISSLFDQGAKLAKLRDPKRFTMSPKVVTNVNIPGHDPTTPQQTLVATIFRELEAEGYAREDITREMVEAKLARMSAIDVPAIEGPDGS